MAAREVLYRRSFHSDGGVESMLELDRGGAPWKFSADGGFEAPRNSLDVPFSGFLETRRHSEVRCEEIPIGYELSRSLTTRRRGDEFSNLKPLAYSNDIGHLQARWKSNANLEPAQKPRAPSVVARLMGLDVLPHHESPQGSNQSSSRRSMPQECMVSHNIAVLSCQVPKAEASDNIENTAEGDENPDYGELPFRNHPQEKQLQEFKREFAVWQTLQGRPSYEESHMVQEGKEEDTGQELNMDSAEFLDALDFLNANKEFFVRVLNDPKPLFSRHLQCPTPSARDGNNTPKGALLSRSFSESRKESRASLPLADGTAEASRQEIRSHGNWNEKIRAIHGFPWGRGEEMPSSQRSCSREHLMDCDERMPTRIVVLKPNLGKLPSRKVSAPSSPSPQGDGNVTTKEGKENMKQNAKSRSQFRSVVGLTTKEFLKEGAKDGLKDARDIARQIVKQVREDMSRRLSREGLGTSEPSGSFVGRGLKAGGDARTTSGMEVCVRAPRDNHRSYSSLPSSPRFLGHGRGSENVYFGSNSKKGEEVRRSSSSSVTLIKSSREASKGDLSLQGGSYDARWSKQSSVKGPKRVMGRNMGQLSSSKARELKPEEVPKVLPRSLSAPAAGIRTCEYQKAETSPFKERLLSLKDSFSLTKKKSNKKVGTTSPCSSPLDSSELSTPRQADAMSMLSSSDGDETLPKLSTYSWPITSVMEDGEVKEAAMMNHASGVLSDNSPTIQHSNGLRHWTSLPDSASETSLDKCEQPSPVSVLETSFQEESPSSMAATATTKCHDKRHERSCIEPDYRELPARNLQGLFFSQPCSQCSSFDVSADDSLGVWDLLDELVESFSLRKVTCPLVSKEELTYIRHILGLSGFSISRPVMAHALSLQHGLKPSVFEKLEAFYAKKCAPICDRSQQAPPLDRPSRRLLFNVVDEVVSLKLAKCVAHPWAARLTNQREPLLCIGRQLLEHIVAELSFCRLVPCEGGDGVLEDAAARDLLKEDGWWPSLWDIQAVVMELEMLLYADLIRELVNEYIPRQVQ